MSATGDDAGVARGAMSLLTDRFRDAILFLDAASQFIDRPSLREAAERILEMDPEDRFTESVRVYEDLFDVDDITEAGADDLPAGLAAQFRDDDRKEEQFDQLIRLMDRELARFEQDLYDRLITDRANGRGYLILAVLVTQLRQVTDDVGRLGAESETGDEPSRLLSEFLVLQAHLISLATSDQQDVSEQLIRDLGRLPYYQQRRRGDDPDYDPEAFSLEEATRGILIDGACSVYANREISVSRGAELADVDRETFEEALAERGIEPRYGPETVAELGDEGRLSTSSE